MTTVMTKGQDQIQGKKKNPFKKTFEIIHKNTDLSFKGFQKDKLIIAINKAKPKGAPYL